MICIEGLDFPNLEIPTFQDDVVGLVPWQTPSLHAQSVPECGWLEDIPGLNDIVRSWYWRP